MMPALVILVCLIGSAFFSGIETGMISIHRLKLRSYAEEGFPWAVAMQAILDSPSRLLVSLLCGNNLCNIIAAVFVASVANQLAPQWGELVAGVALSLFVLIFCEYIPKAWFRAHPIARSRPFLRPLQVITTLLSPLVRVVTLLTDWIVRDPEGRMTRGPVMTRDDLFVLAQESTESGLLTPKQRIMIMRVADLSETLPKACMTPTARMAAVSSGDTVAAFYRKAQETGFSNLPVFDEEKKTYTGLVNLFDALRTEPRDSATPVTRYAKPVQFVSHNTPLTSLFPLMRRTRQSLCLVTGPHGDVVGLITAEDILRLIVGSL